MTMGRAADAASPSTIPNCWCSRRDDRLVVVNGGCRATATDHSTALDNIPAPDVSLLCRGRDAARSSQDTEHAASEEEALARSVECPMASTLREEAAIPAT